MSPLRAWLGRALLTRDFGLLWVAGVISAIGDMVLFIGLPFYVYDLTGSTLASGAMFVVETVPRILLGSVAGVFVDRWDRRRTLIAADLLRAAVLLPLLLLPGRPELLWLVYVVAFVQASVSQFFNPAKGAFVPRLVSRDQLVAANALSGQAEASMALLGPVLGGALLSWFGLVGITLGDSVSFLVSAVLVALIRTSGAPEAADAAARANGEAPATRVADRATGTAAAAEATAPASASPFASWSALGAEWREGLRVVRQTPVLIATFAVFAAINVADGLANVLWVPFARGVLGVGAVEFGWLITATGVGRILGLLLIARYGRALGPVWLIILGAWSCGVLMVGIAAFPILLAIYAMIVLFMPAVPGMNVGAGTIFQSHAEDRYRGRVLGVWGVIAGVVNLASMGLSSALGDVVGVLPLLLLSGLIYLGSGLLALVLLRSAAQPRVHGAGVPAS